MRDGHVITKTFADALWSWRKVKTQTDTVSSSIDKGLSCVQRDIHLLSRQKPVILLKRHFEHCQQKEFLAENTSLTTKLISQKLDELEKMVKHGPQKKMDKLQRKNTMLEIDRELQRRNSQRT